MKKIVLFFIIISLSIVGIFWVGIVHAEDTGDVKKEIATKVPEKIPGVRCDDPEKPGWYYTCYTPVGMWVFYEMMSGMIKWLTGIALLAGVLFIVINGFMLMGWEEPAEVKKRITKWIAWLILLLMSSYILSIIAPWVYK